MFTPTVIPPVINQEDVYLANCESVRMLFEEQKVEMRRLIKENDEIKGRLSFIEGLAASTMGQNGVIDMDIVSSFQVPMEKDLAMINELEEVGVGIGGQSYDGLPDLVGELGFVAAMENAMN
ncbi:hypothetical protein POM88_042464 [Heracleum sosnowskyi]|uniref:Uncharacterized protein n=1 Tax=Heracleum sosnowskyi TaxID=360622 RepID=A0AAD8MC86_9APIA|nr:hypothetical protein POM88_042464 [Heracleum sosnowskyi]